ncbi:MAG: hypothetical protein ACM34I_01845, partial [bacterium]
MLTVLLCLASSCNRQESHSVVGIDPIEEILMVEDHSEVLLAWLKRGVRDMAVVNIDLHDDVRLVPDWKISELKKLVCGKRWDDISARRDRGAESLFTLGNYLYPAYRLGIIKRLY